MRQQFSVSPGDQVVQVFFHFGKELAFLRAVESVAEDEIRLSNSSLAYDAYGFEKKPATAGFVSRIIKVEK